MANLLRHLLWRHGVFILFSSLLLGVFEFLMCALVSSVNIGGAIEELFRSFPPAFQALLEGQLLGGLSNRGILAFGWNHPIAQALGTAVAIVLASRAVAGEIETGAAEILLSKPISRSRYMAAHILFAAGSLLLLGLTGVLGTVIGQQLFKLPLFEAATLIKLALNFVLLQSAWFGLTLALSVHGREGGRVATAGFLLALVSYLIEAIGSLWPKAAFLLPYSLHHYYETRGVLLQNQISLQAVSVLASVAAGGALFAVWHFLHRDVP